MSIDLVLTKLNYSSQRYLTRQTVTGNTDFVDN